MVDATATTSRDLVVGEHVFIGSDCWVGPQTTIGDCTMLAPRVAIVGDDHRWDVVGTPIQFTGRPPQRPTIIGRDVWIGFAAIILRGVTIGDGSIIAAGSCVTRDVPPFEIWAGSPARKLRDRFSEDEQKAHQAMLDRSEFSVRHAEPQTGATGPQ
ncbi:CatB-related O-acetyltransferase [Janibacter terrae]|uniref:CatB-related O-acetyltransferase n=1 Tax=Janibacter terrae TaxID=103817 RepID=A0ABZ2FH40_9MICO